MSFLAQTSMGPAKVLSLGWLPSFIVLPVIGVMMWSLYSSYAIIATDEFLLQQRIGTILHSNEVLTMCARLAASTGQPKWEKRYREIEPVLDQSIVDVALLARTEYEKTYAARTKLAYAKLIEMENLAFALINKSRAPEAEELLFSREYEDQKAIYVEGLKKMTSSIGSRVTSSVSSMRDKIWSMGLLGFFSVFVVFVAWVGIWFVVRTQLAERKRAEEEVRSRNEFLNTVFEAFGHPMLVINAHDYSVERANSAAASQGLAAGDAESNLKRKWDESASGLPVPDLVEKVKQTKQHTTVELQQTSEDGSNATTEVHAYPIFDKKGRVVKILEYWLDVTDRIERERLQMQTARLRAVADLASGVAHNFNNLLQIILSGAELATARVSEGNLQQARSHLQHISQSARFGSGTVKRLQDFASIRHEGTADRLEVFDASGTVEKAVDMCRPWWKTGPEKEGVAITVKKDLEPGCFLTGQEDEFFEVALNLFSNAIHAVRGGGEIHVSTSKANGHVFIRFQDNGVGIARENLDKIFEPFWTSKGFRASGMGLPSSLAIVKRYRGDITVDSEQGKGSRFTIRVALAQENQQGLEAETAEHVTFDRLRIIVIDDEELIAELLEEGLTAQGHTVLKALSGKEGLELYATHEVDVVICDLGMPEMNGWQVGKEIVEMCRQRGVPKTPFILCTGWGGQVRRDKEMVESGVNAIAEKPVDLTQLAKVVATAVYPQNASRTTP